MTENIINQNSFKPIVTAEGAFFLSRVYCSAMILELLTLRRRIKITRFDGANVMQYSTHVSKDFFYQRKL